MIPKHAALAGPVFEMVKTLELDCTLGDEVVTLRIELFQDRETKTRFRARVWERETFRLMPTFPQDDTGAPLEISDDDILAERSHHLSEDFEDFSAADPDAALALVFNSLLERIERITGEPG